MEKKKIAYILYPNDSPVIFTMGGKILKILSNAAESVLFFSSDIPRPLLELENVKEIDLKVQQHRVNAITPYLYSFFLWVIKFFYLQIVMTVEIIKNHKEIDIVFCFIGNYFQLPCLTARLLKKRVICFAAGVDSKAAGANYPKFIVSAIGISMRTTFSLANTLIVESWNLANDKDLIQWKDKMRYGALYFGNEELFREHKPFPERNNTVGFVGRFSSEKGILEFLQAIPLISEKNPGIHYIIAGTGQLEDQVREQIKNSNYEQNIQYFSWVENENLPEIYNQIKLLVVPSVSEGLPNVILEAMACGTPVLATPVGGVGDIVRQGETGFQLNGNDPKEISDKVISLFNNQNKLKSVIGNAKALIASQYSFTAAVKRYEEIINS